MRGWYTLVMAKLTNTQKDKLIAAAQNAIEFTVMGRNDFPMDMLRYDLCWPSSERDSTRISIPTPRNINLKGLKTPTAARWASFGWEVVEASA